MEQECLCDCWFMFNAGTKKSNNNALSTETAALLLRLFAERADIKEGKHFPNQQFNREHSPGVERNALVTPPP